MQQTKSFLQPQVTLKLKLVLVPLLFVISLQFAYTSPTTREQGLNDILDNTSVRYLPSCQRIALTIDLFRIMMNGKWTLHLH